MTPQPAYLDEVKRWIERLDKGGDGAGPQFFVYHLQNTRAERLAPLLQQAFTGRVAQPVAPSAPTLAPGTPSDPDAKYSRSVDTSPIRTTSRPCPVTPSTKASTAVP